MESSVAVIRVFCCGDGRHYVQIGDGLYKVNPAVAHKISEKQNIEIIQAEDVKQIQIICNEQGI